METNRKLAEIEARMDAIRSERAEIDRCWDDKAYASHKERGEALASLSRLSREFDELFEQTPEGKAAYTAGDKSRELARDDIDRMLLTQVFPQLGKQSEAKAAPLFKGVAGFLFGMVVIASMNPKTAPISEGQASSLIASSPSERENLSYSIAQDLRLDAAQVRDRFESETELKRPLPEFYASPVR